ncbi:helix-turn-helix transcriptional regulator [Flavobacterium sp. MAH-1]|uniref:Helix-turn-helix transcriptional regulator n=1 Tax=Flavobacterium agri TaxID=2743471 RepID=A0A7Y9C630_9FLAO|nr:helix-turn-helix transcriptional regulator [Flavobacterium agri]NYA71926.1 helix-turn-helix transcriptional regulator [Flavobacterium agri]
MTDKKLIEEYKKAFGENLKRIRKERSETVRTVDTNTKYDSSNYNKYELGKGNPTLTTLAQLASGLGVSTKDLLDFDFDLSRFKNK